MALNQFLTCFLVFFSFTISTYAASDSYGYGPKPTVEDTKPKPYYGLSPKPTVEDTKPKPSYGYAPKPTVEDTEPKPSYGYVPKRTVEDTKPKQQEQHFNSIGVQGLVYCRRSGSKLIPLQGAVVRITCWAIDGEGYELVPFSLLSDATDANGYFFAKLPVSKMDPLVKLFECKAILNGSPSEDCDVPTDVNNGLAGAFLTSYRLLEEKKMKLYSVGPFVYTSEHKPVNNGF